MLADLFRRGLFGFAFESLPETGGIRVTPDQRRAAWLLHASAPGKTSGIPDVHPGAAYSAARRKRAKAGSSYRACTGLRFPH